MIITEFGAHDAFSFSDLDCSIGRTLTVVTGPNASGKTNLGRIVELIRLALRAHHEGSTGELESRFGQAGRYGAPRWNVYLGVEFESSERRTIDRWMRAALQCALNVNSDEEYRRRLGLIVELDDAGTDDLFTAGRFALRRDPSARNPWQLAWEPRPEKVLAAEPRLVLRIDTNELAASREPNQARLSWEGLIDQAIVEAQQASHMPQGAGMPRPEGFQLPTAAQFAARSPITLAVHQTGQDPELSSVISIHEMLGRSPTSTKQVGFAEIASLIIAGCALATENRRAPMTTAWPTSNLPLAADISSGAHVGLALYRDKNGDAVDRARFRRTQSLFTRLTSPDLSLDVSVREAVVDSSATTILTPVVNDSEGDVPLDLSGAGRTEAAYLATVCAHDWSPLILDEPATNISASAQRLVMSLIRERTASGLQTILITHSGQLVPSDNFDDLASILRLIRCNFGHTHTYRVDSGSLDARMKRVFRTTDVRDALFADGVLLVEGPTEYELLRLWLADVTPTPQAANVLVLPVEGDSQFVAHMRLLDSLGVKWAGLTDGPALRGRLSSFDPEAPTDDFAAAKVHWETKHQVFTLASDFGIDSQAGLGEIEHFLQKADPAAYTEAKRLGGRSKVATAIAFAAANPPPEEVLAAWTKIIQALRGSPPIHR